jgi:hypothetical protein
VLDLERERGHQRRVKLERVLRKAEVAIAADAARRVLAEARKILEKEFHCTQCKAPLPVQQQFFRSYYVPCAYCRTVNTFEPGMVARNVEHFCVHALAEEEALDAHMRHTDAEGRRDEFDRPTRVKLYADYVEAYLRARIRLIPEFEKTLELDRKGKMDGFIQYLT